ncbi:shikimate dehydrogenase [Tumebacillus algifaecis]|uniref:Shikimate dehydrogenase n=1 Tax=Tumebacillus algifaecis TaxID=1214604 RepID=A0A223D0L5_9BACL|nr:shikimate dehydrogenase [Tumebacillus algifaecis]ASS74876.1 shikimate dehydrogenase [Tumebacillus algifaecis]
MGKFGFVIHPFDTSDLARKFPLVDRMSSEWVESFMKHAPPISAQHMQNIDTGRASTEGWLVATTLTSRQLLDLPLPFVLRKIIAACKKAERQGAQIIGLGALTAVVGDAGISVARQLSIPVTTGNSYTVATAIQATCQAASLMGIDLGRANLCVVGATGSIGAVCARMMAASVGRLILSARDEEKLEDLAGYIFSESAVLADIQTDLREAVREADIILAVSSAAEELIHPEDLKPGAVVCDVARPRDVSRRVAVERDDVLVIEGGLVEVPGGWGGKPFSFGLPHGIVYACMAETMLLALENRFECFTLGRTIQIEQVREIDALARKHGFQLAAFRSFERLITPDDVLQIKRRAEQKVKKKILAP